jgi:hypothetical protein
MFGLVDYQQIAFASFCKLLPGFSRLFKLLATSRDGCPGQPIRGQDIKPRSAISFISSPELAPPASTEVKPSLAPHLKYSS